MNGATPEEINDALLMAKHTANWSSYLNGVRYDEAQLHKEVQQIQTHMAKTGAGSPKTAQRTQPRI